MKVRISLMAACSASIARSTRPVPPGGKIVEPEGDRIDALDDAVMQVAPDPLALLYHGERLHPLAEPRVLDGQAGMQRESLHQLLVIRRELGRAALVGQVQVAHRPTLDADRHAEEGTHRRMVGRKSRAAWVGTDVGDAQGLPLANDEAQ